MEGGRTGQAMAVAAVSSRARETSHGDDDSAAWEGGRTGQDKPQPSRRPRAGRGRQAMASKRGHSIKTRRAVTWYPRMTPHALAQADRCCGRRRQPRLLAESGRRLRRGASGAARRPARRANGMRAKFAGVPALSRAPAPHAAIGASRGPIRAGGRAPPSPRGGEKAPPRGPGALFLPPTPPSFFSFFFPFFFCLRKTLA